MRSLAGLGAVVALLTTSSSFTAAQSGDVIHASVIVARTGERTPLLFELSQNVLQLTTYGSRQMFTAGQAYRSRYIESSTTALKDLSTARPDQLQVYALTADDNLYQFYPAAATAFMQGLYPPVMFSNSTTLDPSMLLANGTIENAPLGGYNYVPVHAPSVQDPDSIYIQGYAYCPIWQEFIDEVGDSVAYQEISNSTQDFYLSVGQIMEDSNLSQESYDYSNAYVIWDYLSYMANHDETVKEQLTTGWVGSDDAMAKLHYLSDQHEFALYGNISQLALSNNDQISLIGGQTMAAMILGLLQQNVASSGALKKFSLLVAEYPLFLSWFALANLLSQGSNFAGIPDWASTMVFELFSKPGATLTTDGTNYPLPDQLYVRFLFQNGTTGNEANDTNASLTGYPLFGQTALELSWTDFSTAMSAMMISNVDQWCDVCNSWDESVFCAAFNPSTYSPTTSAQSGGLTPKTAGVIGAVATLAAVLLSLILLTLLGGVRFTRTPRKTDGMGGFKGGQKLASDPDLTIIKGSTSTNVEPVSKERVSSWELKNNPPQLTIPQRAGPIGRLSVDEDDRIDPFAEPVRPDERV